MLLLFSTNHEVSDDMFDAADIDHSNGINQEEFESIIAILRAHILSQLLVVYFIVLCWSLFRGWQGK